MKITCIIPARGGSQRLKEKNIYPVWGKPMIYWAIQACKNSRYQIDTWVTTDSLKIAEVAKSFEVKVVMRDESVSNSAAYKQSAIRDAASKIDSLIGPSDIYISLQANSPEVKSSDIDLGIETLLSKKRDEIISVDKDGMQNGAFRVFRGKYVYQCDLSTNCGFVICDLHDVHTIEDVEILEKKKYE